MAIINTRDTVAVNGIAPAGGVAFAGARGIARVEASVSGGSWQPATLKTPSLSPLTWVPWRFEFPASCGEVVALTVRCTDGEGHEQIAEVAPPHADGASGYHRAIVIVR